MGTRQPLCPRQRLALVEHVATIQTTRSCGLTRALLGGQPLQQYRQVALGREGRREHVAVINERITVTQSGIVHVELTREAQRHGAMLALPETVVLARPEGFEPPTL